LKPPIALTYICSQPQGARKATGESFDDLHRRSSDAPASAGHGAAADRADHIDGQVPVVGD